MSPLSRLALAWLSLAAVASAAQPRSVPLVFEENLGQAPASVRYLARSPEANVFFEATAITISLRHASAPLRLTFNRSSHPDLVGDTPQDGTSNYLIGRDPSRWHTGIPHFRQIRYRNLYPGIDVVFYGSGSQLEFDFILQPGANLDHLSFRVDGAPSLQLREGDLVLRVDKSELRLRKPFTYQVIDGKKRAVSAKYRLAKNRIGFTVGPHSDRAPLIIDPVFDYATYLGGSGPEWGYSVTTDRSGAIYVSGVTQSTNFPAPNGLQRTFAGGGDIFITKLNPDSSGIQYSTYIGGSGAEGDMQGYVGGIAVDASGNVFIAGVTRSPDFPTTATSFQPVFGTRDTCGSGPTGGPCGDAFILKLNPAGTALVYSSFLGGANHDEAKALALDTSGNAYVTGITSSSDFPTTSNAFDRALQYQDAFVSKISADGSQLLYSTLLGGSGYDLALAIAIDSQGRAHVGGMTESADFPVRNALDTILDPPWDAFVTRLNPEGSDLELSTLLGGSGTQQVLGIALDSAGDIYVAGYTDSADFPIVHAFQPDYGGGGGNGFATKLKADGSSIVYSTFFGGQDAISELDAVAVNDRGEAYVAGSGGSDFPIVTSVRPYAGSADAVLAKLTPDGSAVYYSTFFGGNGYDLASSVALDPSGYVLITGETSSSTLPTHWAAPQHSFGGVSDAFVARFSDSIADGPVLSAPKLINLGTAYVNQASPPKTIRISNTGSRALHINAVTTSSNVSASTDCAVVEPGTACALNVSITLTSAAPGTGTVTLNDDSPDSPQTFTVRATGAFGGDLEVVSLSAAAPFQSNGLLTVPFTAVIRNNGPYDADSITLRVSNNVGGSECTPCSVAYLAAGASATVKFNRTPATFGMLPVTVTVGSRSPDINPVNDSRTVTVAVPVYVASSSTLDFGTQPVNSTGLPHRIVFTGLGYGPFRLSLSVTGEFVQTNTCGTPNDDGCYVDIYFKPSIAGSRLGSLVVIESVASTNEALPLTGTGVLAPNLILSSNALDFGTRMIGRASSVRNVALSNTGSATLQIASITSTPEFSVTHNCPVSLAQSASCILNLTFTPLGDGARKGTVTIQDNAPGNPHTLAVSGTGAVSPLTLIPAAVEFGPQRLNVTTAPAKIGITNVGGLAVHVTGISSPSGFQQTNDCSVIQPDATCQLEVTFTPKSLGNVGGTLIIYDDAFGSPRSVPVSGTGVEPALSLDRSLLSFPSTRIQDSAATQFVTVMNTGNTSMLLKSVAVSGDFEVINGCGSVVAADDSCFFVVTFRPTASGTRTGELVIYDDAPSSPHRVSLIGTGRAQTFNLLPSTLTYASQAVGTNSQAQTVFVTNDTSATISVNSVVVTGDYAQANDCPQKLVPDAACSIHVVFSPKAAGLRNGTLTLTASTGQYAVSVSGVAAASAALITPSSLVFSPTLLGGASAQTVTVVSAGTAPLNLGTPSISGIGFSYVSNCPKLLPPGQNCSLTVRFAPAGLGNTQGSLTLVDDAPGSPRTIALSGSGLEVSISTGRPQRSNRNTPAVKPTESRISLRAKSSAAQASTSADAVLRTLPASTDLGFENHAGPNSASGSAAPNPLPWKLVSGQFNSFCGSAAPSDRRSLPADDTEVSLPANQELTAFGKNVDPSLIRNNVEDGAPPVDRLDLEATGFQLESGSGCDRNLPADQLGEGPLKPDTAASEHSNRAPRQ